MELIFDSIEERDRFFDIFCLSNDRWGAFGVEPGVKEIDCNPGNCRECWEKSGLKWSIKKDVESLYPRMFMSLGRQLGKTETMRQSTERAIKSGYFPSQFEIDDKPEEYFLVMPRHCGRTAAMKMIDEMRTVRVKGCEPSQVEMIDSLDYAFYNNKPWKEALETFMGKHDRIKKPQIERVIFNDPATIVFWKDGTKTVVKCQNGDKFDPEKGLAMAICKKVLGDENGEYWTREFKKWLPEESDAKKLYGVGKLVAVCMSETMRRATESMKKLERALDGIAMDKRCHNCVYEDLWTEVEPCRSCVGRSAPSNFKPKVADTEEPQKSCEECEHSDVHEFEEPCRSCKDSNKFEEKEKRVCPTCMFWGADPVCVLCQDCGDKRIHWVKR